MNKEEYLEIIDFLNFFYGVNLIATAELRKEKSKFLQKQDQDNFYEMMKNLNELVENHFDLVEKYKELEKALDKACDYLERAIIQCCGIFDEYEDIPNVAYSFDKNQWKEWCLNEK